MRMESGARLASRLQQAHTLRRAFLLAWRVLAAGWRVLGGTASVALSWLGAWATCSKEEGGGPWCVCSPTRWHCMLSAHVSPPAPSALAPSPSSPPLTSAPTSGAAGKSSLLMRTSRGAEAKGSSGSARWGTRGVGALVGARGAMTALAATTLATMLAACRQGRRGGAARQGALGVCPCHRQAEVVQQSPTRQQVPRNHVRSSS